MRYRGKLFFPTCVVAVCFLTYLIHNNIPTSFLDSKAKGLNKRIFDTDRETRIWYDSAHPDDFRILSQMTYVPKAYKEALEKGTPPKKKLILRYSGFPHEFYGAPVVPGEKTFANCPVNRCEMVANRSRISEMDAVVFEGEHPDRSSNTIPQSQIWAVYKCECPFSTHGLLPGDQMNWTATYRRESTIAMPSYKFIPHTSSVRASNQKNYAMGKTKQVAWFVSNCFIVRNKRMEYARELAKYITVDIYGNCGDKKCGQQGSLECFEMLRRDYKFYLSFENANCRQYITEKFYRNALMSDTLPIAMGAAPEDYRVVAPPYSFLHVDDFDSPRHLAEYLHLLDKNDTLYNSYFKWKGSGRFISSYQTNFWCRFCALLHAQDSEPPTWYDDVYEWWRGDGICVRPESWKEYRTSKSSLSTHHQG